jgi:hypothetical protein
MSGRLSFASSHRSHTLFALTALGLTLSAAPLFAQTMDDPPQAPIAPAEPPVAPPAPDAPPPAPSEPAPPSQAPQPIEPTPAPTPTPEPAPAAVDASPPPAEPGSSAAFAPLASDASKKKPSSAAKPAAAAPVAAAHSAPEPPPKAAAEAKNDDDSGGLFGPFRLGVLVGTGLPEVLNFGAQLKLTRFFGAGVNVGIIPTVKINYYGEAKQEYQEYDVYGHIYPFGGSFFLGAGVGYAQIDGTLASHIAVPPYSVDITSDAVVRTMVLTPQIGFMKIFDVGFAFGFDIGAQIPIAPSEVHFNTVAVGLPSDPTGTIDFQRDYIDPNDEKVRRTLDKLGRTPLPTFAFKIGWFL